MKKQMDKKEQVLNSLSGIGVVLISALGAVFALYVLTVLVRLLFAGAAA